MHDNRYYINLENIFKGPMDLLVYLIQKNEVDIYDIPIGLITDQYVAYIEWMQALNIDLAGDFLVLAATLMQIKSKMLLPVTTGEEEDEDPRLEIVRPLAEYLSIKTAAEQLSNRDMLGETTFKHSPCKDEYRSSDETDFIQVGLFELIDSFQTILERITDDRQIELYEDEVSVRDRILQLVDILQVKRSTTLLELFDVVITKSDVVITFLAILEMVKTGMLRIIQHSQTGAIRLFYL